ncbi:MAG: hypothetical protein EAZ51_09920, partial [Sphingobacteriales bacterium]
MKKLLLFIFFFFFLCIKGFSETFYFNNSGALTDLSSWDNNFTSTGTIPLNFTGSDTFVIASSTDSVVVSLSTAWTLGANTIVQIGSSNSFTHKFTQLTITSTGSIVNATVNIDAGKGDFIYNTLTIQSNTIPKLGTLSTTLNRQSSVNFAGDNNLSVPVNNYGDLIISGTRIASRTITFPSGTIGVSRNFTITTLGTGLTYSIHPDNIVNLNGSSNQSAIPTVFTYSNLTLSNQGSKNIAGVAIGANGILSIQGNAYNIGAPSYNVTSILEFKNFTTSPRSHTVTGATGVANIWSRETYGGGGSSPNFIRVASGAIINIDDVITSSCRLFVPLEITGTGRVSVNNACRLDLFKDLTTTSGGELTGVAGSRIHISGIDASHDYGRINTAGYLCLDKDVGTAIFKENVNASDIYVWNPQDATAGNGGTFSFNPLASITAGTLTMGQAAPGTPVTALPFPIPTTLPNTNGTLLLNNANLVAGISHIHTITGNVTILD